MNINELIEIGKVFIQWGIMLITFGMASLIIGAVLIYTGYCVLETQNK